MDNKDKSFGKSESYLSSILFSFRQPRQRRIARQMLIAHCQPLQFTHGRASSSQVIHLLLQSSHFGTIGAFPFRRLTCSRRCQLALDLSVRGTGHLYPPFALSGRLLCGWYCFIFDEVIASVEFSSNVCYDFICS